MAGSSDGGLFGRLGGGLAAVGRGAAPGPAGRSGNEKGHGFYPVAFREGGTWPPGIASYFSMSATAARSSSSSLRVMAILPFEYSSISSPWMILNWPSLHSQGKPNTTPSGMP